jgi:hypothetical protein
MTELIGVLVTAAVTLVSTLRWPTLQRRIRDHVGLVKDLPTEMAGPLRTLLEREVEALARRESRRLDPWQDFLLQARRVLLTVVTGAVAMAVAVTVASGNEVDTPVWLAVVFIALQWLGVLSLAYLWVWFVILFLRGRGKRSGSEAQEIGSLRNLG